MAVQPQITVNVPAGLGTYRIFRGSGSGSFPENYAEVHFYPALGSNVEWNVRESITVTYNNGREADHYENLGRWNGFSWMVQEDNCHLAEYILGSSGSTVASYRFEMTIFGSPNSFQYQLHDPGMGSVPWLHRDTTVEWTSEWDPSSQTSQWTRTGKVTSRSIDYRMDGTHPYVPGSREGEEKEFYGSMYGPCISALWGQSGPNPDVVNSYGPTTNYREGSFNDYWYHSGTYDYDYQHNMVHLYWWRPWLLVSCDFTDQARWDERQEYDPVHYPGGISATCSPAMLTCYLDLSTYGQGGSLPTPHWQGHELCVSQTYPDATWFDRSNITATRAKPIYETCVLTSMTSDHRIYCAWRNLSSEVDVYCYAPSQSKYIDFRSGDYPSHVPDPATGAYVYKYGSYSRLILSGPVGTDGWHYKYLVENSRRAYFYVYGSTSQGQYKYLSSGTDNGTTFHSEVTPYDNEEYWFYTDGYNHTIVFNFKKNGRDFTYLPMYYPSSGVLIRGVSTNLPIRDGDA